MLLINLIALLAYSLLERQAQQQGMCLTARRTLRVEQLAGLQVIEIEACDGSQTQLLSDITPDQRRLLLRLRHGLEPPTRRHLPPRRSRCSWSVACRLLL